MTEDNGTCNRPIYFSTSKVETTFGMVKPEGIARNLIEDICRRIREAGLEIEQCKTTTLTVDQCALLYGATKAKLPRIYGTMEKWLTENESFVMVVKGPNAVSKLLELRGSSNPADSPPGTIRGDYARDQDYRRLLQEGHHALNVFHASGSKTDADREMGCFFGHPASRDAEGDYFYSKTTGLYVSRRALMIDARVKTAADAAGVRLDWDDEGRINNITFNDARLLLQSLESKMLTPVEYWKVITDAAEANDMDMIKQLTSERWAEWLDRVYLKDGTYIDNPQILGPFEFEGKRRRRTSPYGGPGWFNPEGNINSETGEPIHVELNREKYATSWKYWSPDIGLAASPERSASAPIRGYITSVGKPSLDLGIPAEAKYPNLMIRECRTSPLSPIIDSLILNQAEHLIAEKDARGLLEFLQHHGNLFAGSEDTTVYKLRERFFDMLGECSFDYDTKKAGGILSAGASYRSRTSPFRRFIKLAKRRLQTALAKNENIVFVMGHKNPDTDAVVSTLFEAWRNHLLNGDRTAYIPVVQAVRLPPEVAHLLRTLSKHILLTNDPLYLKAKSTGLARWISVDQNREPEVQKYFIAIVDHHMISETAKNRDIPKTLNMVGSSSTLVTRKLLGMGLDVSERDAKILYGATLMDTENRVEHKMTEQDVKIMNYLKKKSKIRDDNAFYQELMGRLLNTDDAGILFWRDYKEDWGFGFAVAKIKNGFTARGGKLQLVHELCRMAIANTRNKNLPLTLMKITDYEDDNETVNVERVYFAFNPHASAKFRESVQRAVESIIRFEFPMNNVTAGFDRAAYIDFQGTGMQLSRKKTAPVLQPIVAAFNRYFYSPRIGLWVKRDFLHYTKEVRDIDQTLSTDTEGRINRITFPEAKQLATRLGVGMLTVSEYWQALSDAKSINDIQMIESLQGSNFVEFWDTAIIEHKLLADHPALVHGGVSGVKKPVQVPHGCPGLIDPGDIDLGTGLPNNVMPPGKYGNPTLWRYWEPDSDLVFPCRSYIFLMKQPSWDGKFHLKDSFPNLGLRPTVETVTEPDIQVRWDDNYLTVTIFEEGERKEFKWPKKISGYLDIE